MYFHLIEGAHIILTKGGVFRQAPAYRNDDREVFAKFGGGFVRVTRHGTSVPKLNYISHDIKGVGFNKHGHMTCA